MSDWGRECRDGFGCVWCSAAYYDCMQLQAHIQDRHREQHDAWIREQRGASKGDQLSEAINGGRRPI